MRIWRRICCAVLAGGLLAGVAGAKEILYIHNTRSGEISKVSIPGHEVIGEIPIGLYTDYVAVSPDQGTLYVNRIEGLPGVSAGAAIGDSGELIAIDTASDRIRWRLPVDGMPHHMTASQDGRYNHGIALTKDETMLFANGSVANYVAVYSHPKLELIKTIPVGTDPNYVLFGRDGRFAYVSNRGSNDLSIIDVAALAEVKRLKLGRYPQRMVIADVP